MTKVLLTILLVGLSCVAQTVTVDVTTNRQTIRAWAAGNDVGCVDYPVSCQGYRNELLDTAVAMGLNGVHMTLQIAEVEDNADLFQTWINTNADAPHANRNAWIANNGSPTNDNADPNTISASGLVWGRFNHTMNQIVVPMRQKLAARGEKLHLSFVMGHTSLSNQYFVDNPAEYGEWVLALWNKFQTTYGFVPDALEIMGEPDHGDRQVTPAELVAMLNAARTRLLAAGHAEPLFYAPGTVSGPAARQYYLDMKTANATAAGYIDVLTYHRYVDIDDTLLGNLFNTANTDGKLGTGMTEYDQRYNISKLWADLKVGHGVLHSALSLGYPSSTDWGHLLYPTGSGPYTINKVNRVKYMEHIWKYVRGGAVAKRVTNSHASCDGLAFRNPNGTYVVVLKASGAVTCTVANLPPGTYGRRRTQGDGTSAPSTYDSDLGNAVVTSNQNVTFTFSAAGIGTIYNLNYLNRSAAAAPFDFEGDGKTDLSIMRPGPGEWWINRSSTGTTFAAQFGGATDKLVPADFTGDGKTDIAVWRPSNGEWLVLRSEDFSYTSFPFGANGDIPSPADYDADRKADPTVFRPSSGTWFVRRSSDGETTIQTFGAAGDIPVPSDYDGDGRSDIAIYRPSLGQWWLNRSSAGVIAFTFGNGSDKPVQGDYTGDGKADAVFWRPSTGEWFVLRSENLTFFSFPFGTTGDIPAPGDYDGDGRHDATVFRPSTATWFSNRTTAGTLIQQFGSNGDRPIPNAFVP